MIKRYLLFAACALLFSCNPSNTTTPTPAPTPTPVVSDFVKGADIGWVTEMEDKGYNFYTSSGTSMECTALMKALGFNAIRHRVWVDPMQTHPDGTSGNKYCGIDDLKLKCLRVKNLGMKLMIDFHYSDWWADPGKQNIPASWTDHSADALAVKLAAHTTEVLTALKNEGIDVSWVQVGNEVTNGMLWETCRVKGSQAENFVKCFNAGADAVKAVYPDAKVILHIDNGWNMDTVQWFFDLVTKGGAKYEIIGLSLYPEEDWNTKTLQAVQNLTTIYNRYKTPIMFTEFGMPAYKPELTKAALQYILDSTKSLDYFKGIFFWEPESEQSRNNYSLGAFENGKPTSALDPILSSR